MSSIAGQWGFKRVAQMILKLSSRNEIRRLALRVTTRDAEASVLRGSQPLKDFRLLQESESLQFEVLKRDTRHPSDRVELRR